MLAPERMAGAIGGRGAPLGRCQQLRAFVGWSPRTGWRHPQCRKQRGRSGLAPRSQQRRFTLCPSRSSPRHRAYGTSGPTFRGRVRPICRTRQSSAFRSGRDYKRSTTSPEASTIHASDRRARCLRWRRQQRQQRRARESYRRIVYAAQVLGTRRVEPAVVGIQPHVESDDRRQQHRAGILAAYEPISAPWLSP